MEIARKGVIALAVLVSTAVVSISAAADGGPPRAYPDRPSYPSIWQGLYAGVHIGFGDGDGVLGGGQLGYNWQSGRVVYGFEADFAVSSIEEEVRAATRSPAPTPAPRWIGWPPCAAVSAISLILAYWPMRRPALVLPAGPRKRVFLDAQTALSSSTAGSLTSSSGWVLKARSARRCRPASTF